MVEKGQKYKKIEPIYELVRRIETYDCKVNDVVHCGVYGMYIVRDQFGKEHVVDLNEYELIN